MQICGFASEENRVKELPMGETGISWEPLLTRKADSILKAPGGFR